MKTTRSLHRRSAIALAACCVVLAGQDRAARAEGLLDYVGADTGFAVRLHRIPDWASDADSLPLVRRLKDFAPVRAWMQGTAFDRLRQRLSDFEKLLGMPVQTALGDAIGNELLLAVDPQAPGGPAGVVLTSPRSRATVQQVLDVLERRENAEVTRNEDGYFKRVGKSGKAVYYVLADGLFAISDREERIQEIALLRASGRRHPHALSETAEWRRAAESLSPETLISVYFRPALWKPVVPMTFNTPGLGPVLREMASAESLTLGISDREGLHAELNVLAGPAGFSPPIAELAGRWASPADLWRNAPDNGLLSIVLQGDSAWLAGWVESSLPDSSDWRALRSVLRGLLLDRDPIRDVLPRFGSEIGVFVVRNESSAAAPVGGIVVIPYHGGGGESLRPSLENLARTGLRLAHSQWNPTASSADALQMEQMEGLRDGTLYWLGDAPVGRPAAYVGAERVWLASDPDLIRRELQRSRNSSRPPVSTTPAQLAEMQQVVYLDVRAVRALLSERKDDLLDYLGIPGDGRTRARELLSILEDACKLCDAVYAGILLKSDRIQVRIGLTIDSE